MQETQAAGVDARFLGTWELVDCYSEVGEIRKPFPLGERVEGRLYYDSGGNIAAQMTGTGRAPFSSRNPQEIADAEYRRAFQSYTAYYGTWSVRAAEGIVVHRVQGATVPDWPGQDQIRYFSFDGDRLTLRTPPMRGNDGVKAIHTLVWRKLC